MHRAVFLLLTILLFFNGSCDNKESNDNGNSPTTQEIQNGLSSKSEIFEHLKKENPDLDENDVCIVEIKEFEDLFVMGYFASDRGCSVNSMYYKGEKLPGDHSKANIIMESNDFKENAEKLIENYHIKVVNTFKTVVWTSNEDFGKDTHFEPKTYKENGMIISQLWIQRPSGMLRQRSYYVSTLTFDKDGNFVSIIKSNEFSVSF